MYSGLQHALKSFTTKHYDTWNYSAIPRNLSLFSPDEDGEIYIDIVPQLALAPLSYGDLV